LPPFAQGLGAIVKRLCKVVREWVVRVAMGLGVRVRLLAVNEFENKLHGRVWLLK
jgi:hypothetical protein